MSENLIHVLRDSHIFQAGVAISAALSFGPVAAGAANINKHDGASRNSAPKHFVLNSNLSESINDLSDSPEQDIAGSQPIITVPTHTTNQPGLIEYSVEVPNMSGPTSVSFKKVSKGLTLEKAGSKKISSRGEYQDLTLDSVKKGRQVAANEDFLFKLSPKVKLGNRVCANVVISETGSDSNSHASSVNYTDHECTTVGKPISFSSASYKTFKYFQEIYNTGYKLNFRKLAIDPKYLEMDGACNPNNNLSPPDYKVIDNAKKQKVSYCATDNGHREGESFPRKIYPLDDQRYITYSPLLQTIGAEAVSSAGLIAAQQGTTESVTATRGQIDIKYARPTEKLGVQLKQYKVMTEKSGDYKIQLELYS